MKNELTSVGDMEEEKIKQAQDGWEITTERFVCYVDIMGFKNLVTRNKPAEIHKFLINVTQIKNESEKSFGRNILGKETESKHLIRTTSYSDSIIIYTKDASPLCFERINWFLHYFVDGMFMRNEPIPFRGSVAKGLMTLDFVNSIFFGQPLIDAYLLQQELGFYGIVMHSSVQKEIDNQKNPDALMFSYQCPLKNGSAIHSCISPLAVMNTRYYDLMKKINSFRHRTSGVLRSYIDNTELFLKSSQKEFAKHSAERSSF